MKDSTTTMQEGEFLLIVPGFVIMAPISLNDDEGEELFMKAKPFVVEQLQHVKDAVEAKFDNLRVGFDIS